MKRSILLAMAVLAALTLVPGTRAQYALRADIISGGATDATGGSYRLRATVGEPIVGPIVAAAYALGQGFWYPASGTGGSPAPLVEVTLTPINPPIIIPSTGGFISYDVTVANNGVDPVTLDYWIVITGPVTHDPLRTPHTHTLPGGMAFMRTVTQRVPGAAPTGAYTYTINVGTFPATVEATDSFPFEKAAPQLAARTGEGSDAASRRASSPAFAGGSNTETARASRAGLAMNDQAAVRSNARMALDESWWSDWDDVEWTVVDAKNLRRKVALEAMDDANSASSDANSVASETEAISPESLALVTELPETVSLASPFPNPFNARTTLRFGLPEAGMVRLVVYDVLGREVAVLVDGPRSAGSHEAEFDGGGLAVGLYIVRLDAVGHSDARRMTLAR